MSKWTNGECKEINKKKYLVFGTYVYRLYNVFSFLKAVERSKITNDPISLERFRFILMSHNCSKSPFVLLTITQSFPITRNPRQLSLRKHL